MRHLARDFGISEALAHNLGERLAEAGGVVHGLAGVVAEALLCEVAVQVVWFHRDVRAIQVALQK